MKSFQLIVLACFIHSCNAIAQSRWGLSAGPTYASLHDKENYQFGSLDPRIGFNVGAVYAWSGKNNFGVEAELAYTLAGGKGSSETTDIHYLMLPASITYSPLSWMKLGAGPQAGVFLGSNSDFDFRTIDVGVQASVEFTLNNNFGIQVKNYFGLVYDTLENNAAVGANDPLSPGEHDYKINRNNIFQVNLRYYFSAGK